MIRTIVKGVHRHWSTLYHQIGPTPIAIITIYFTISLSNIVLKNETEWFPFFSFKLYSRIPNHFVKYDLLFNEGTDNEHFLLQNNNKLNDLERKYFQHWLTTATREYLRSRTFNFKIHENLLNNVSTISFVRISGDYIDAVKNDRYKTEIISTIK